MIGTKVISPINLLVSTWPKVSSPLVTGFPESSSMGLNEMPMVLSVIFAWASRLSVTVATVAGAFGPETVCVVRSVGPIPRIPSTPLKPCEVDATPIDWPSMTRFGPRVTVSRTVDNASDSTKMK